MSERSVPAATSRRAVLGGGLAALGGVLLLSGCKASGASDGGDAGGLTGQAAISGLESIICAAPYVIAADKFYGPQGIDATNVHVAGGTDTVRAILAKSPAGSAATISAILAYQGGAKNLRVIGGGFNRPSVVFVSKKGAGIASPADLAGKKIGIAGTGSPVEFFANLAVTSAGLTPGKDAEIVTVGDYASVWPAVAEGVVDLGALVPPQSTQVEVGGEGEIAIESSSLTSDWADVCICTTAEELERNPSGLKAWMSSVGQALDLIREKPTEAAGIWGKALELDPEVAEAALASVPKDAWTLDISEPFLTSPAKAAVELGLAESDDIEGLYDSSVLDSL
ncbi:ABC transporter substrate-binding protein [Nocardioides sp. YIM 152315]|uniref:ABC transporter substrate-binding protein n=1 Tax=Nocardioides sp. YIM 152315 TaxID=3031760 RepID=UPI0023DBB1A2|nr:ABC transporter substrate-binding protein [Nocardioides sp. YIM 152315]